MYKTDTSFGKWPWCKVCNKPCETVEWNDEIDSRFRNFMVKCHEMQQTMRMPMELLVEGVIEFGWAFDYEALDKERAKMIEQIHKNIWKGK